MTNYPWIEDYCLAKSGAELDHKLEWNATRFMIRSKMFAMQGCDAKGQPIITIKLSPSNGQMLRHMYPIIVPGYYMNKEHWNSVPLLGDLPDDVLMKMLDEAYDLILNSFSKKVQAEILLDFKPEIKQLEKTYPYTQTNEDTFETIFIVDGLMMNHVLLPPGKAFPKHPTDSEVYALIIRGELSVSLNHQEAKTYPCGQVLYIPKNTISELANYTDEVVELFVTKYRME